MKYYAGIGSRATPDNIQTDMTNIASILADNGYILRSGGALGADRAFENGAKNRAEIFLPRADSPAWTLVFTQHFHPNPSALSDKAWMLMNRNAMQILGRDGDTPVDFIICWTRDGKASGGTGQALRIAADFGITVYNMFNNDHVSELANKLANIKE
jgi:hypothetical protein